MENDKDNSTRNVLDSQHAKNKNRRYQGTLWVHWQYLYPVASNEMESWVKYTIVNQMFVIPTSS